MASKDADILRTYREASSYERFKILMNNFSEFPKVIRKIEKKTQYKIKADREYLKSRERGELGVRIMDSNLGNPTAQEAIQNITIEEAFRTGIISEELLKDMDNATEYEADIRLISIMRDDYELLEEIIEDLNDRDCKIIKALLIEGRMFREIAVDEGRSYETIKKRIDKIRMDIWEDMEECLEKHSRERR